MPRISKGPHLYLRKGRTSQATGRRLPSLWYIRDGEDQVSTGCFERDVAGAQAQLVDYIAKKQAPPEPEDTYDPTDPTQVYVAEVLALYVEEVGHKGMDPPTFKAMVRKLDERLGEKTLSEIKRSSCQAYVKTRCQDRNPRFKDQTKAPFVSDQTARRELEILSAAIGHWDGENKLTPRPSVWLPDKPDSPRDALTRSQAAALLKASMGYRKQPDGSWKRLGGSAKANRAHLRRFILMGLYTGSRHTVITRLLWHESPTHAWIDLEKGMVYRRGKREKEHATKRRPVVKMPPRLKAHMTRWHRMDVEVSTEQRPITSLLHHGGVPIKKVRKAFENCVRDAGLSDEITPHWLRHTCATWLMEKNVDMWDASAYAGMTVAVLEKHYAHHRPDHQKSARTALSKAG